MRLNRHRSSLMASACRLLFGDDDPRRAEAIGDHTEARGERRGHHGHLDCTTVSKHPEQSLGFRVIADLQGNREAAERGASVAATVGCEDGGITDSHRGMHYLVFGLRRGAWHIAMADDGFDLGSQSLSVELQSFGATALKEEIRLSPHRVSPVIPQLL